jgi:hypothetical protein
MLKIQVSTVERHFHADLSDGTDWQDALGVFLDALRAMGYLPPTLEELGGEEVIQALSQRVETLEEAIIQARQFPMSLGAHQALSCE